MVSEKEEEKTPRASRSLMPIISAIVGVLLTLHVLLFFSHAYQSLVLHQYQLDYGEGPILQIALNVARGGEMYPPVERPPYLIASYMPLYYAVCALGVKLAGPTFLFGRLVSTVSALVIAVTAGLMVFGRTRHWFAAYLTGGMILAMPHFMVWATFMRVDMAALALAVVGFACFTSGGRWMGMTAFSLAALTRRTSIAAMGAAFIEYARERRIRAGLRLFLIQVLFIGALVVIAIIATKRGLYHQLYLHSATSVGKAWSWGQLRSLLWAPGGTSPLGLWPGYFIVIATAAVWSIFHRQSRALLLYFGVAGVIFLTGGRIGSSYNYLLEPTAVGAMLFGVMWGILSRSSDRGRLGLMIVAGVLTIQMTWTLIPPHFPESLSILRPRFDLRASRRVVEAISETDGPVLCEDTGLTLAAGKEPPLMPFEFTMMARVKALDPKPIYDTVKQGGYALVVLRFNPLDPRQAEGHTAGDDWNAGRWPDGIITGVQERYRLAENVGPYFLFVPK